MAMSIEEVHIAKSKKDIQVFNTVCGRSAEKEVVTKGVTCLANGFCRTYGQD